MSSEPARPFTRPEKWVAAAADYQAVVGECTSHGTKRLVNLVDGMSPFTNNSYTVDVGAGTGSLTFAVHARNNTTRILATDIAEPMLKQIDEKAIPGISTQHEDAVTLSGLPDDTFTHGMSSFTLQFVPDPAAALKSLHRVIAPGGAVGVALWGEPDNICIFAVFRKAAHRLNPDFVPKIPYSTNAWSTPAEHKFELESAGFIDVKAEVVKMPFPSGDAQGTADFVFRGTNPVSSQLIRDWVEKGGSEEELEREYANVVREDYEDGKALFMDGLLGWGFNPLNVPAMSQSRKQSTSQHIISCKDFVTIGGLAQYDQSGLPFFFELALLSLFVTSPLNKVDTMMLDNPPGLSFAV